MREFRKNKKTKPWWEILRNIVLLPFGIRYGAEGHEDRMRKRRLKSRFDR
ncbi:hypothetical protein [Neolewinella persica]|nr:hypothetical protein [Neolewinella persica]